MSAQTARSIIEAVAYDGFEPTITAGGLRLEGPVDVGGYAVRIAIEFKDLSFSEPPYLWVVNPSDLPRPVTPHVDERGELCAVDRAQFVFDRHKAPELARGLIQRAKEVLERGLTRHAGDEIAAEFPRYWANQFLLSCGRATGRCALVADGRGGSELRPGAGLGVAAFRVATKARLTFGPKQARPDTLGELLDWIGSIDSSLPAKILEGLRELDPNDPLVVIDAPNGTIIALVRVSASGAAVQASLGRRAGWRRMVSSPAARKWPIARYFGRDVDIAHLLSEGDPPALTGRKVILIGCGAIGGYLARMLAQMGAGLEGSLLLIDPDPLDHRNVRRHALGLGQVSRFKAEACAERIVADLPGLNVSARARRAQDQLAAMAAADVVIDATGEQGLSEFINAWAMERQLAKEPTPTVLHVWINGNGAAVQSFISTDMRFACYRCLRPDMGSKGRFDPLLQPPPAPVTACGDAPSTPYDAAAAMAAASLAARQVADWATGKPVKLLQSQRLDWTVTRQIDPTNPRAVPQCPACQRAA